MAVLNSILAKVYGILLILPFIAALDPKIINGTVATGENFGFQVSIRLKNMDTYFGGGHMCGGSLIKPSVVLSAAHCFYDEDFDLFLSARNYIVVMGTLNRFENTKYTISLDVTQVILADFKRPTFENDVALLFLNGAVPASNPAISVIPLNREVIPVGTICQVTGWGTTEAGYLSDVLMVLDVPIIDSKTCSTNLGEGSIKDGMICAGYMEGERDACQGDSGGPLVSQGKQVGIVSFGYGCAEPGYPGIYADVRFYYDWIEETIKKNSGSSKFHSSNVIVVLGFMFIAWLG